MLTNISDIVVDILEEREIGWTRSKTISEIIGKIDKGAATHADLTRLASESGMDLGKLITGKLQELFPGAKITEEDALELLVKPLRVNYEDVADAADRVQNHMNERAGLGLKAVRPKFNADRAEGIAKNISSWDDIADHVEQIIKEIENNSMSVVDDSIRENAKAHSRAGLDVRVTRIYDGIGVHNRKHSCSWCLNRCGTDMPYDTAYEKGAFQRHPGCHCELFYKTSKGVQRQTDWRSNTWGNVQKRDIIKIQGAHGKSGSDASQIQIKRTIVMESLEKGVVKDEINVQSQSRHTEKGRDNVRSYIYGDINNSVQLYHKLKGTGSPVIDKNGNWTHKERVSHEGYVGEIKIDGKWVKTNKAMIVYSNTGSHIYPRR